MNAEVLLAIVLVLLGGGLLGSGATLWRARIAAKAAPVERDSIIVTSAESAVTSLSASLEAETARADRAEAEAESLRATLTSERNHTAGLMARLNQAQASIEHLNTVVEQLRIELQQIIEDP